MAVAAHGSKHSLGHACRIRMTRRHSRRLEKPPDEEPRGGRNRVLLADEQSKVPRHEVAAGRCKHCWQRAHGARVQRGHTQLRHQMPTPRLVQSVALLVPLQASSPAFGPRAEGTIGCAGGAYLRLRSWLNGQAGPIGVQYWRLARASVWDELAARRGPLVPNFSYAVQRVV